MNISLREQSFYHFPQVDSNHQAVGWDSGVSLCLSNFLEDILQPTSLKMSPTSNSSL